MAIFQPVKISLIPHVIFESTSYFSFTVSNNLQCYQAQLLCTFLVQTLYTLFKSSPSKCKFLRFSSDRLENHQISNADFELVNQFLFKFCIILYCHDT